MAYGYMRWVAANHLFRHAVSQYQVVAAGRKRKQKLLCARQPAAVRVRVLHALRLKPQSAQKLPSAASKCRRHEASFAVVSPPAFQESAAKAFVVLVCIPSGKVVLVLS